MEKLIVSGKKDMVGPIKSQIGMNSEKGVDQGMQKHTVWARVIFLDKIYYHLGNDFSIPVLLGAKNPASRLLYRRAIFDGRRGETGERVHRNREEKGVKSGGSDQRWERSGVT